MSRAHALLLAPVLVPLLAVAGCTSSGSGSTAEGGRPEASASSSPASASPSASAELTSAAGVSVVPGARGAELAAATSKALYERAAVVVVAPEGDGGAQARAASFAVAVGAPLLLSPIGAGTGDGPGPARDELTRLAPDAVVAFSPSSADWAGGLDGDLDVVPAPVDPAALVELAQGRLGAARSTPGAEVRRAVAALPLDGATPLLQLADAPATAPADTGSDDEARLPGLGNPVRRDGLVVLAPARLADGLAAVATARAAGAEVHVLADPDPRASSEVVTSLARKPAAVLALGDGFGPAEQVQRTVAVASTGVQLPGGGQLILPGKLYVALYGHPGSDALGVLGEQGVDATIARAKQVAAEYTSAGSTVPVVPSFEIITSVASSALGDGDYSDESDLEHVRPLVEAAGRAGIYVVLDLQPGYDDFLTQAKQYEELLALPHVGLALDAEWRLKPGERHMRQIGRVGADEVNEVVTWLADLTRDRELPQKMLLLHQFKTFMLEDRDRIEVTRPELSIVTQMDGHGSPSTKLETWNVLRPGAPPQMRWGWKNFYDEDQPMLTPRQTLDIRPTPVFVSYQ